jgi:hypothetical protein
MPRIIKPAKGTFTSATVTVDSSGRVVSASSGAGAANMVLTTVDVAPLAGANGTFTATNNTSKIIVYMRGGGGGSGNLASPGQGGGGGYGAFGVLATPISQPFSVPYALGAGGSITPGTTPGAAGTASTFNTNFVANGGSGGSRGGSPGIGGIHGSVTGSSNAIDLTTPGTAGGDSTNATPTTAASVANVQKYCAESIVYGNNGDRPAPIPQIGVDTLSGNIRLECGFGGQPNNQTIGNVGIPGGLKIYEDIG